jgi:hypothetical protein
LENPEEMDIFGVTYDHPKLNQENINQLNSSTTSNEIEMAKQNLPKKKSPEPDRFTAEFYQNFKEELTPTFFKCCHEIEKEGALPNSYYKTSITLILKQNKDIQKKREL